MVLATRAVASLNFIFRTTFSRYFISHLDFLINALQASMLPLQRAWQLKILKSQCCGSFRKLAAKVLEISAKYFLSIGAELGPPGPAVAFAGVALPAPASITKCSS